MTISYTGDATIAGALGGTAQFSWLTTSLVVDTFFPLGKPIDIGPLSAVPGKNSFFISFRSLRRSDIMSAEFQLRWKVGPFDAFAFLTTPNQVVPGPLTLPLQFFYPPGLPVYPPDPPSNFSGHGALRRRRGSRFVRHPGAGARRAHEHDRRADDPPLPRRRADRRPGRRAARDDRDPVGARRAGWQRPRHAARYVAAWAASSRCSRSTSPAPVQRGAPRSAASRGGVDAVLARCIRPDDGRWFVIGMLLDRAWPAVAQAIGRPELLEDARFDDATASATAEHGGELIALLDETFLTAPASEWVAKLNDCRHVRGAGAGLR